jgi:hypothetical protein
MKSETFKPIFDAHSKSDKALLSFLRAFLRERVTLGGSVLILLAIL